MNADHLNDALERAAALIHAADALLIGAGAGLGVDSGLPDFRGVEGFWKAYPPFRKLNKSFQEMSNPHWFRADPAQAWGFFGHRMQLYRAAQPHAGFAILKRWAEAKPAGHFIFTSNVDGQFQKAGFDSERILECHGTIHFLQCTQSCSLDIWSAAEIELLVDPVTIRAAEPFPHCPRCGALARPNILMFSDFGWNQARSQAQLLRYQQWLREIAGQRLVALECGAGLGVPTVRIECEIQNGRLIRINPREPETPPGGISVPLGAREALERIDQMLSS